MAHYDHIFTNAVGAVIIVARYRFPHHSPIATLSFLGWELTPTLNGEQYW